MELNFPERPPKPTALLLTGQQRVLVRPYAYNLSKDTRIVVPAGFVWDQASVPRVFWSFISPFDLSPAAALIHDWLYRWAGQIPEPSFQTQRLHHPDEWISVHREFTRREAEDIFQDSMRRSGIPLWRRRVASRVTRLTGFRAFRLAVNPYDKDGVLESLGLHVPISWEIQ